MGSLQSAMLTAAASMRVFQRALTVVENNVTNASTAGFAKQQLRVSANSFDSLQQLPGGVFADGVIDYRDRYVERVVWRQTQSYGYHEQRAADLSRIEPLFDVREGSGISAALNNFFQSFSSLSTSPNDVAMRQVVLDNAARVAGAFNLTARGLNDAATMTDRQLRDVITQINSIGQQLYQLNQQRRSDFAARENTGIDSKTYALLDQLAELADVSVIENEDGTLGVYIGGESMFVSGGQFRPIQMDTTSSQVRVLDVEGNEITAQFRKGRMRALIEFRNETVPSYVAQLNLLARTVADRVNQVLSQGVDLNGQPPVTDLFTYDDTTGEALTLAVNPLTPAEIAAAHASAPGGNGNALDLASLGMEAVIGEFTFAEYYGNIAARVGRDLNAAVNDKQVHSELMMQARSWRQEVSGVNLDEEAARLVEIQRAYQAAAKLLSVLNDLTGVALSILP